MAFNIPGATILRYIRSMRHQIIACVDSRGGVRTTFVIKRGTNQSVENACVVFVKGANERNESFEKINKQ